MLNNLSYYKIPLAIIIIVAGLLTGVAGYMIIEGISFLDALYMSVITIATVGYSEVTELSEAGKIFTIILIILYIGIFTYIVTTISSFLIDKDFRKKLINFRMEKTIHKLKNHVIVCGFGRNGEKCCDELFRNKQEFVIIEKSTEIIKKISSKGYLYVEGDATEDEVMENANILQAKALITSLPIDADNVYVVLTCRKLNPDIKIISRAAHAHSEEKLKTAGADHVVMPEIIGGHYMSALVNRAELIEFYHLLTDDADFDVCSEELDCSRLKPEYIGKSISELDFRKNAGVMILAIKDTSGNFKINPDVNIKLNSGIYIIVLGNKEQVSVMKSTYTTNTA